MSIRNMFDGMTADETLSLSEEIVNRMTASDISIRVCDELDDIMGDKLAEEVHPGKWS
ncbi:MAG: hypothetical protein WD757_00560 [Actinomycetota bacterium]